MTYRSLARGLMLSAVLTGTAVLQSCGGDAVVAVEVVVVSVNPPSFIVFVDQTQQLTARARDGSDNVLSGRTVTWSSSNPDIASVSASGLVRALQAGPVTIRAEIEGVVGTASVTVRLRPQIVLSESAVEFESAFRGGPTATTTIRVTNGVAGTLSGLRADVTHRPGGPQGWLETALTSTTAPADLAIRALPSDLEGGTYEAEVRVSGNDAGNSPQIIRVTLVVEEAPPELLVSAGTVSFAGDAGQAAPPPRVLDITNGGGGVISGLAAAIQYAPGSGNGWLQATLSSTTATATASSLLTIIVNPQGLIPPAVFDAVVAVTATSLPGALVEVRVRFRFGDPPPEIDLETLHLLWEIIEVSPTLDSRSIGIDNRGTGVLGSLSTQVSFDPLGPQGWLTTILGSLTAPTGMDLVLTDPGFTPGDYSAQVMVFSPNAINSPQTLDVLLRVLPRPSLSLSSIAGVPPTIVADGLTVTAITVQLIDIRGAPITTGHHEVTLQATAGTLSPVVNNGDGTYSAQLTSSTVAGISTVTGTVNGAPLLDLAMVTFAPGPPSPATTTITALPTSIIADGISASTVTVQAIDVNGNPLTTGGAAVLLSTTAGTLGPVTDNMDGTYTATLTSPTLVGTGTVTGTVNGAAITDNEVVQFVPGAASTATSLITALPTSITADGVATATVTVQLVDANGNNLTASGGTVALVTTSGTLSAVADNMDGTYTAALTSSTTAGAATVTGTVNGAAITDDEVVQFTAGTASAATSLITAAPTSIVADGVTTSTITVQLRDPNNNNLTASGGTVALATTAGTLGAVTDNMDGTYTAILMSSTTAGPATVTGTLDAAAITDNEVVQFVAGIPASIQLTGPANVTAGMVSSNFTLTVIDAFGNASAVGQTTRFTLTSSAAGTETFTPASPLTVANGSSGATFTYANTLAGAQDVTATYLSGGTTDLGNATHNLAVVAGAVSAANSTAVVPGGTSGAVTTMVVTARDANGNPVGVGGATVVGTVEVGSPNAGATVNTLDNGDGTYDVTYTPTATGTDMIAITLNAGAISGSPFSSVVVP